MIKSNSRFKLSLTLLLSSFLFSFCIAQKNRVYNLVTDFGAIADNKTDNYNAFLKAAATLSKAGSGTLIIPRGNYYIAAYKIHGGANKNNITDIIFKNCNGLIVEGNNSVLRINGNFSRNRDYKLDGIPYNYAFSNTVCLFKITNCKNVLLRNFTVYGEADKMKRQPGVVEGENYGVYIADDNPGDTSSGIMMQHITAHHFAADGFLIKSNGKDIVMNKCTSNNNARQGLSIVKGNNIKCLNSTFDSTGFTGVYSWHAPGAGIDVENEFGPGKLNNVLIQNCSLRGNKGFQIVTTLPSDTVVVDSCFISDLTAGYSDGLNGVGIYSYNSSVTNCTIFATIQIDIADQIYKGPSIQYFSKNLIYSGYRGIISADFSRPAVVTDNIFIMLPKPKLDTYFPYLQNGSLRFNRNIVVVHADRIKKEPNQVTALVQLALEASDDFWLMNGYDIAKDKRQTNYYYPALNETKLLRNHFFPPNKKIVDFIFPQKKFLTAAQAETILKAELFTAYKQTGFNKKYLLQANIVKQYTAAIVAGVK